MKLSFLYKIIYRVKKIFSPQKIISISGTPSLDSIIEHTQPVKTIYID